MTAVRYRLSETTPAGRAYGGRYDSRRTRLLWLLIFPARIIYLVEETGDVKRFGFGYGTLPGHAERGEERFSVEWNREDGCVYCGVFAFSCPKHPLTWPRYPFARALQRRFARDSKRVMLVAASA